MFEMMFGSVFETSSSVAASVSAGSFLLCSVFSLVLGLACAGIYMFRNQYSKNFVVTLALLPFAVQMVILLVNGNLGAGIAVMGVFNLVRFRSIPGSAKDIGSVFFAMAIGLATGMGFLGLAVLFTIILGVANAVYVLSGFGSSAKVRKTLRITVPEDVEFDDTFDQVIQQYCVSFELVEMKTSNMGSLYNLEYEVEMKASSEAFAKEMIDQLRCLNGNLKVSLGRLESAHTAL